MQSSFGLVARHLPVASALLLVPHTCINTEHQPPTNASLSRHNFALHIVAPFIHPESHALHARGISLSSLTRALSRMSFHLIIIRFPAFAYTGPLMQRALLTRPGVGEITCFANLTQKVSEYRRNTDAILSINDNCTRYLLTLVLALARIVENKSGRRLTRPPVAPLPSYKILGHGATNTCHTVCHQLTWNPFIPRARTSSILPK